METESHKSADGHFEKTSCGALAGLRVLDLSRVLAGPYCTQILGDHGADVIKVEPPQGDDTRSWGPPFVGDVAAYYLGVNRNKRGIALDLAQESHRKVIFDLLSETDVLVENFKPGTLERWGFSYQDVLSKQFPRLIYCRISGFGGDGPLGALPGYDAAVQALSGLMSVNGDRDGPALRVGVPIVDMVTGINAVVGILLALQSRNRSGVGQFIEATLFDSAISILHPFLTNFLYSHKPPTRYGNAHPNITPYDVFATATTPIFVAVGNDGQFRKLCEGIGCPDLARDPRFESNRLRNHNRQSLTDELSKAFALKDGPTIVQMLMSLGVPCAPILGIPDIAQHPHTQHRGMLVKINDYRGIGAPVRLSQTPAQYRAQPPGLGEHNASVISSLWASDLVNSKE